MSQLQSQLLHAFVALIRPNLIRPNLTGTFFLPKHFSQKSMAQTSSFQLKQSILAETPYFGRNTESGESKIRLTTTGSCKRNVPLFENSRPSAARQLGQPMHSQSTNFGKFKLNSLNLALFLLLDPVETLILTSGISMREFQKPPPLLLKLNANLERFLFRALQEKYTTAILRNAT